MKTIWSRKIPRAAMILTAILMTLTVTAAAGALSYLIGDADNDGRITIVDATKIQRVLVELDGDPDGTIALRADIDGDGLNIMDATVIQRYLADYDTGHPVGQTATMPPETVFPSEDEYETPIMS